MGIRDMGNSRCTLVLCLFVLAGCQGGKTLSAEIPGIGSAMGGAAGAIVGHQYGQTGVGQSVGSKIGSVGGQVAGSAMHTPQVPERPSDTAVMFCPVGGERYPNRFKYCPLHGAELQKINS